MWTKNQKSAIDAPVSNILVAAAAGSGKTAVMVERIINRILQKNGVDIDKILVVTYTNAAASEIKERIQTQIIKKLEENPNDEHLQRQLILIDNAKICTIHSLCLDIIKKFFYKVNLDASLRIGDVLEVEKLKNTAIDSVFERYYNSDDNDFLMLVDEFCAGKKTDKSLVDITTQIYNFSRTVPHSEKWIDMCCNYYADNNFSTHNRYLLDKIKNELEYALNLCDFSIKLCNNSNETFCLPVLLNDRDIILKIIENSSNIDSLYDICNEIKFMTFSSSYKKEMSDYVLEKVEINRKKIKDIIKRTVYSNITVKESDFASDCVKLSNTIGKLCEIALEISREFENIKREKNIIDFSDFEHYALKILENDDGTRTTEAEMIAQMFEEIYIDEYQDCNHIQDRIFKLISRCYNNTPNIFMVGDVKQSIYKFRDAAPMLFVEKLKSYSDYPGENGYLKISLSKNFRSRKEILNGVNFIFKQIMSDCVGEIEYDDYLIENENKEYNETPDLFKNIDVVVLSDNIASNIEPDKENLSDDESVGNLECEANFVSEKIKEIIDSKVLIYDKQLNIKRPVTYKDIVILMRSTNEKANVYEKILKEHNIPVFSDSSSAYFTSVEISTLMSLMKIVINPIDDINLVSVLRSSMFNFNDNELMKIRLCNNFDYFYYSMTDYVQKNDDELSQKIRNFLSVLNDLKDASHYLSTDEFMWYMLEKVDYFTFISTLPMAKQKNMNIISLINKASQFENTDYKGIFNFTRFVDDIISRNSDTDAAKVISENDDVVRIMSIHKSKGLEFPVVFLVQCGKKFNFSDENRSVLCHKELGIGIDFVDYEKRFSYTPNVKKAISEKIHLETLSEEERVLYVALTRAREKLYIVGTINNSDKYFSQMSNYLSMCNSPQLPHQLTSNANTYFDWILPAIYRHSTLKNLQDIYNSVSVVDSEGSSFICNIIEKSMYSNVEPENRTFDFPEIKQKKTVCYDEIARRLEYKYPHKTSNYPTNVTVTELKKMFERESNSYNLFNREYLSVPKFKARTDGAYKGTLLHKILQETDFSTINSNNDINNHIEDLINNNIIKEDELELINAEKIFNFISSNLGKQIKLSNSVYKETSFKIEEGVGKIFDNNSDEKIIIQGTIDLFFLNDDDKIILVDYKTDKLSCIELESKYNIQLKMYKKALEKMTGKLVSECYIYSFYNEKEILIKE